VVSDIFASVVIVGASGQLGHELTSVLADKRLHSLTHEEIEIQDEASVQKSVIGLKPSLLINTAAFHNVERCEQKLKQAFAVNAFAVDSLSSACSAAGSVFAHISTDYVFDGLKRGPYVEVDWPNPLNVYAMSKLAGEFLIRRHNGKHYIIRTSGLYGIVGSRSKGYTFIDNILKQAEAGKPIRVVDDMFFSPSYTLHVAQAIRRIIENAPFGIYHVAGSGYCSWYEFAKTALEWSNIDADIAPIKYADFQSNVKRPMFSALENRAMKEAGLPDLPHWKDGLRAYLTERAALRAPSA